MRTKKSTLANRTGDSHKKRWIDRERERETRTKKSAPPGHREYRFYIRTQCFVESRPSGGEREVVLTKMCLWLLMDLVESTVICVRRICSSSGGGRNVDAKRSSCSANGTCARPINSNSKTHWKKNGQSNGAGEESPIIIPSSQNTYTATTMMTTTTTTTSSMEHHRMGDR